MQKKKSPRLHVDSIETLNGLVLSPFELLQWALRSAATSAGLALPKSSGVVVEAVDRCRRRCRFRRDVGVGERLRVKLTLGTCGIPMGLSHDSSPGFRSVRTDRVKTPCITLWA